MSSAGPPQSESPNTRRPAAVTRIGGAKALAPLRRNDLSIGVPVPYPIYDAHGRLLLRQGEIVDSERQLATLRELGLYSEQGEARSSAGADEGSYQRAPKLIDLNSVSTEKSFAQLRLMPGTVLHMDFLGDSIHRPRVALRLVGFQEFVSVMLSAVDAQGSVVPFREGELLLVKVIAGNDIGAFTALVQKIYFTPFPYIHIGYPDTVQMKVLRKHARVDTRLIVSVARDGQDAAAPIPALAVNLSASGMRLEVFANAFVQGDRIKVALRLPAAGDERTLTISSTVRTLSAKAAPVGKLNCGVEFDELPAVDRLILEHYVFQGLLEGG